MPDRPTKSLLRRKGKWPTIAAIGVAVLVACAAVFVSNRTVERNVRTPRPGPTTEVGFDDGGAHGHLLDEEQTGWVLTGMAGKNSTSSALGGVAVYGPAADDPRVAVLTMMGVGRREIDEPTYVPNSYLGSSAMQGWLDGVSGIVDESHPGGLGEVMVGVVGPGLGETELRGLLDTVELDRSLLPLEVSTINGDLPQADWELLGVIDPGWAIANPSFYDVSCDGCRVATYEGVEAGHQTAVATIAGDDLDMLATGLLAADFEPVKVGDRDGWIATYHLLDPKPPAHVVMWSDMPGQIVRVSTVGLDREEALDLARNAVQRVPAGEWEIAADRFEAAASSTGQPRPQESGELTVGWTWNLTLGTDGHRRLTLTDGNLVDEIQAHQVVSERTGPFTLVEVGAWRERGVVWATTSEAVSYVSLRTPDGQEIVMLNVTLGSYHRWAALLPEGDGETVIVALDADMNELGRVTAGNDGSALSD